MTYKIISTLDGSTKTCSLSELSRSLKLNCILAELNTDSSISDSWPLVHETLVTFAVEFADYALLNYSKQKIPEAEACITLTRKWLENHNSVSNEELKSAAAAYAAYFVANAAANAAYAAHAAAAAAHAADAAAYAACAAAADAAGTNREAELIRQGQFIMGYLRSCHFAEGGTLEQWRGKCQVQRDNKKEANKRAC